MKPAGGLTRLRSLATSLLQNRFRQHTLGNSLYLLVILAVLVGAGAGVGSLAFRLLLEGAEDLMRRHLEPWLASVALSWIVPGLGGLAAGLLIYHFAREAKGHGVPEVMKTIVRGRSEIRPRVVVVKALASAFTLGSGGSAGSEGPIIQIGAAWGSSIGQILNFPERYTRTLLACGAAAGIAAIFNAPLGGVLFALEIILVDFGAASFMPVVISAVLASAVVRGVYGNAPVLAIPDYGFAGFWELAWFAGLGAATGASAVVFIKLLYAAEDVWDDRVTRLPEWAKPAVGGMLVGLTGIFFPGILGVGYDVISEALHGEMLWSAMATLLVLKLFATCMTLGSGGSGGVFAPSLFMGAMLGGGYGCLAAFLSPGLHSPPGSFAVVGMAAMVAASTHAPLTAMLIIFEMTGSYSIILPLMLATLAAVGVSRALHPESIYTLKLARLSLKPHRGRDLSVLDEVPVSVILKRDYATVDRSTTCAELSHRIQTSHQKDFPVLDSDGRYVGVASFHILRRVLTEAQVHDTLVAEDILMKVPVLTLKDSLADALRLFAKSSEDILPVTRLQFPRELAGIVTRSDLMRVYEQKLGLGDRSRLVRRQVQKT